MCNGFTMSRDPLPEKPPGPGMIMKARLNIAHDDELATRMLGRIPPANRKIRINIPEANEEIVQVIERRGFWVRQRSERKSRSITDENIDGVGGSGTYLRSRPSIGGGCGLDLNLKDTVPTETAG